MSRLAQELPELIGRVGNDNSVYYFPASGHLTVGAETPKPRLKPGPAVWELDIPCPVTRLAFVMTKRCNLNCSFCYNQFHKSADVLSHDILENAVNDLAMQPSLESVSLILSGGEPMMHKKGFMALVKYAENTFIPRSVPLYFTLYTNGTIMDEDTIRFIADHKINVIVSLDGPQEVHDRNRQDHNGKGTFVTTLRNTRRLRDSGIEPQARAVVSDPQTDLIAVMETLLVEGFTRMHLMPAYDTQKKLIGSGLSRWLEALIVYEKLLERGIVVEITPFYRVFRKLIYPRRFADSHYPCTAGRNMLGVGSDGFYYLCHHYSGAQQKLGQVGDGLPQRDSYLPLVPSVEQRELCGQCWARHICGGPCYHRVYIGGGPESLKDCSEWQELLRQTIMTFSRLCVRVPNVLRFIARGQTHMPEHVRLNFRESRSVID